MGTYAYAFGPDAPEATYLPHDFEEHVVDIGGGVSLNYVCSGSVTAGSSEHPALLLIPGQGESWWGYEEAIPLLAEHFEVFAVDLRGQGRSTRTPGRYTLDNMGNDLVRFIDLMIGRPTFVSGLSSGGVLSAWLSAYAKPGQIIAAVYEDPPLFSSVPNTSCGQSIRQSIGPMFALWAKYLGDQWSIGDWEGMVANAPKELPVWLAGLFGAMAGAEPPQNLKEYDPEWGRAFWEGTVAASCDHAAMLAAVRVPVLLTHHFRFVDETSGTLMGAMADIQAARVVELVTAAGQPIEYRSFPTMGHSMHGQDPQLYTDTVVAFVDGLTA